MLDSGNPGSKVCVPVHVRVRVFERMHSLGLWSFGSSCTLECWGSKAGKVVEIRG